MVSKDVLLELFGRLPAIVRGAVEGLSPEQLALRVDEEANSIAWLVWHLTRIQDDHVAEVADPKQVWQEGGWAARFGLQEGTTDTGYGHSFQQVTSVRPESADALVAYYDAVAEHTSAFLQNLTDDDLERVVDRNWDPPVTLGVRLVSVAVDDLEHAGQAAYARGLLERNR